MENLTAQEKLAELDVDYLTQLASDIIIKHGNHIRESDFLDFTEHGIYDNVSLLIVDFSLTGFIEEVEGGTDEYFISTYLEKRLSNLRESKYYLELTLEVNKATTQQLIKHIQEHGKSNTG